MSTINAWSPVDNINAFDVRIPDAEKREGVNGWVDTLESWLQHEFGNCEAFLHNGETVLCVSRAWSDATEQMTVIGKLFNAAKNGIEKPGWPLQLGGLMLGVDLDLIVEARKGATACKTAR